MQGSYNNSFTIFKYTKRMGIKENKQFTHTRKIVNQIEFI